MTQKKKVANTLTKILDNKIMKVILDRSQNIETVIEEVDSWWRFDLHSRKPGPAYIGDEYVGTDLDLACFLYELASRNAVINIPKYKSMRAGSTKEGQVVLSDKNRHGNITGLVANKDVFSFSLRIRDMNVLTTNKVGEARNFSITDLDGDWYSGWGNLEFLPTAKENKFIFENKLNTDNNIQFKNFIHPNRWSSIFGQYYFITKCLVDRLREESSYYNKEIKSMIEEGINYPPKDAPVEWPETEKIPGKKIKVKSFEVELDIPDNDSTFPKYKHNQKSLVELSNKRRDYLFHVIPKLNFAIRTVEYAYYKYGKDRLPVWLENVKWEKDYVTKGKRTKWDRIILFQQKVGEVGISLKKRIYETTQEVAIDYDHKKGKLKNYIAIVLDESGSMNSIRGEAIGAFNQQVDIIKANSHDMETSVSLVTFSTVVGKPQLWNETDLKLKHIGLNDYNPDGLTALHDAIGYTIEDLKKVKDIEDPSTSFLMVVITDGEENNSKKWKNKVSGLIKEVQDTGKWTVTFLGANMDVDKVSRELHIPKGNTQVFASTSKGMKDAGFTVSMGLNSYYGSRRLGHTSVEDFYDQDKDKKD